MFKNTEGNHMPNQLEIQRDKALAGLEDADEFILLAISNIDRTSDEVGGDINLYIHAGPEMSVKAIEKLFDEYPVIPETVEKIHNKEMVAMSKGELWVTKDKKDDDAAAEEEEEE